MFALCFHVFAVKNVPFVIKTGLGLLFVGAIDIIEMTSLFYLCFIMFGI